MAESQKPKLGGKMENNSDQAGVPFIQTPVKVESARQYFSQGCSRSQGTFKQIGISRNEDVGIYPDKSVSKLSVESSSEGLERDCGRPQNILVYIRRKHVKKQQVQEKIVYSRRGSLPDTCKEEPKGIVPVVVAKLKHPRIRKQNDKKTKNKKNSGHEEIVGKKPTSKVELDERTLREWEISMGKLDSQQGIANQGEREWWEKERESLHKRIKSFISNMQLIQGEMKFSQWKGSVLDSVVGAYLTQNVTDTLSSSAFISLAARFQHGAASVTSTTVGTVKYALRSCRSKMTNDKKTYSAIRTENAVSTKSVSMGKPDDPCLKTETSSRKKRRRSEDDAIHWDALKKYYCKDDHSRKKTHVNDKSDALDWEAVRMAKVDDIAKAIHKRGMSNNLAARIKNCLNMLENKLSSIDLEWIRDVPPHKAREHLMSIPGLGLKSVECIRLLTLQQNAFPIDTNAGRVAVRLGWVPIQPLPQGQQFHLLKEYPKANSVQKYLWPRLSKLDESTLYELHCQMITLGKVFCTKRNPNCNACPMRAECKHYASILESSQLALPLPGVPDMHSSNIPTDLAESSMVCETAMVPIQCVFPIDWDIEDFGLNGTPQIRADENIHKFINKKNTGTPLISKALMVLNSESASVPVSKLKNATYLRTEHQVYELPDWHCVLEGLEKREPNDSCPYLLATWPKENLDKDECNSEEDTVYGTLLLPIRTAMRGKFPLDGTFFQANEVFADDESCEFPIQVSLASIWDLPCATLYCGTNVSAICRGMKTHEVRKCFRTGYLCSRRFNRKTRETKPLSARFYFPLRQKNRGVGRRNTAEHEENDA